MTKQAKGRCGLTLQQNRKPPSLIVSAVTPESLGAEAGFQVGDALLAIDDLDVRLDMRYSKIKANGVLFDAKGSCTITVQRPRHGAVSQPDQASSEKEMLKEASQVLEARAVPAPHQSTAKPAATGGDPGDSVAAAVAAAEAKVKEAMARAREEAKKATAAKAAEREVQRLKHDEEMKLRMEEAAARARAAAEAIAKRRKEEEAELALQIKAKVEEREAEERAAAAAASISAEAEASSSVAAPQGVTYSRGDTVVFENPRTGALELATVVAVRPDEAEPIRLQLSNGTQQQTVAQQLTKALGAKLQDDLPEGQLSYKPPKRLGSGNPHFSRVPALDLTARGIGGNARSAFVKPKSNFLAVFN